MCRPLAAVCAPAFAALVASFVPSLAHAQSQGITTPPTISGPVNTLIGRPGQRVSGTLFVSDDRPGLSVTAGVGTVVPARIDATASASVIYSFDIPANASDGQRFNDTVTVTDATQLSVETAVTIGVDAIAPQANGPLNLIGAPGGTVSATLSVSDNREGMSVSARAGTVTPQTIDGANGQVSYSLAIPQGTSSDQTLTDTIVVTDGVGNETAVPVNVAVDNQPPQVIGTPLNLTAVPGRTVGGTLNVSDDKPGISVTAKVGTVQPNAIAGNTAEVSYTFTVPPDAGASQTFSDTITFTDNVGNSTVVPVTIASDLRAPRISGPSTLTGMPGEMVSAAFTISDDHPNISVTAEPGMVQPSSFAGTQEEVTLSFAIPQDATSGQRFTVVLRARDAAGNVASANVTVELDQVAPSTSGPLNLSGLPGATVSGTLLVRDNWPGMTITTVTGLVEPTAIEGVQGQVVYSFAIPADAIPGLTINNRITVRDASGNSANAQAIIKVNAVGDPQISLGNLVLSTPPGGSAMSTFTVMDDQPGITIAVRAEDESVSPGRVSPDFIVDTSGEVVYTFPVPATATSSDRFRVNITATDAAGNQTSIDATISTTDINSPQTPDELNVQGAAGEKAVGTLTVSDDQRGISVAAVEGTVDPDFIEAETGEVTYAFSIPREVMPGGEVIPGQTFSDTLTITDAAGNMRALAVKITVAGEGFADTPNLDDTQRGVAVALDAACAALVNKASADPGSLTPDEQKLQTTCENLRSGTEGQLDTALDQLAPSELSSQGTMAVEAADGQARLIGSRLSALRGGATGVSVSGLSFNLFGQQLPQVVLESALPRVGASKDDSSAYVGPFGIFISGNLTMGDKDRSFNEPGFDFDARDITVGGDYRFTPEVIFGAALGYGSNETVFDNAGGNIDFDATALSFYGTYYQSSTVYIDGIVSFGTNSYDTRRRISFATISEDAVGDTDGTEFTVSIGGGYDLSREAWTFGPYGRLTHLSADIDGYQESPTASGVELSLDDQEITSLTSVIGGKAIYNLSMDWGVFSPQVNLEWEHEFDNDSRLITGRFVNDPSGTRFAIPTDEPDRDVFNLGAGATATITGGRTAFIFVDSLLGHEDLTRFSITGGFRFEF